MKEIYESIAGKIRKELLRIREDKKLSGRLYIITLGTALLILAVAVRGPEQKGKVYTDDSGNAIEIERHTTDASESYEFEVSIDDGDEPIVKEVKLTIQAVNKSGDKENEDNASLLGAGSREYELEASLDNVINEISYSRTRRISLPDSLSDGTGISWKALSKKDYSLLFLIPAIYIALVVFVIRSGKEKGKSDEESRRKSILKGLPRFCNQLFLMMNAGMILSDAFEKISESYASRCLDDDGNAKGSFFEREIASLSSKNPNHRMSTAGIIKEFAVKNDVKEMIRIATILTENEKRGSDVIESLSRESRYLWDERKIVARESGKMIDTKMSYPLGILLVLLIVITMAPAMLSM